MRKVGVGDSAQAGTNKSPEGKVSSAAWDEKPKRGDPPASPAEWMRYQTPSLVRSCHTKTPLTNKSTPMAPHDGVGYMKGHILPLPRPHLLCGGDVRHHPGEVVPLCGAQLHHTEELAWGPTMHACTARAREVREARGAGVARAGREANQSR